VGRVPGVRARVHAGRPADRRAGPPATPAGFDFQYGAFVQGVDFSRFKQNTDALELKTSYVSQFQRDQQLKVGTEFQWPRVRFGSPGVLAFVSDSTGERLARFVDQPPRFPGVQQYRPFIAAGYDVNAKFPVTWVQFEYYLNPKLSVKIVDIEYIGSRNAESFLFLHKYADRDTFFVKATYFLL